MKNNVDSNENLISSISVVSSFHPDCENKNGPTGLLFEFIEYLKKDGIEFSFVKVNLGWFGWFFSRLGFYINATLWTGGRQANKVCVVYPFWLAMSCLFFSGKRYVLCPDATSLVLYRFSLAEFCKGHYIRSIFRMLQTIFTVISEISVTKLLKVKLIVVSDEDAKYLKKVCGGNSVFYLRHPVFSTQLVDISYINNLRVKRDSSDVLTVLVYGNFESMQGNGYFEEILLGFAECKNVAENIKLLVYGRKNKFIFDIALTNGLCVEYSDWFADFSDVITPRCVSLLPIIHGGGTKTRLLMSLANGIPVISHPHSASGLEEFGDYIYQSTEPFEIVGLVECACMESISVGPDPLMAENVRENRSSIRVFQELLSKFK